MSFSALFLSGLMLVSSLSAACEDAKGLVEKAKLLYADQQRIEAQEAFLEALQIIPVADTAEAPAEEQRLFLSFLPEYEDSIPSKEGSERFFRRVEEQLASHPSYASLEYYAAVSLANQGH